MKFQADIESLTVLVAEGRYCRFIKGLCETNNAEEIAALRRAKSVKELKVDGGTDSETVKKAEDAKGVPKKSGARSGARVGNYSRPRRKKRK